MQTRLRTHDFAHRLSEALAEDRRILAAYLHGSVANGSARADSDVDCALLLVPDAVMSARDLMMLTGELSGCLGLQLDLGIMSHRNLVYFTRAIDQGMRIFCRDAQLTDALVGRAFALYAQLRMDRQEVERAYHVA